MQLEVACFSLASARTAISAGADRIELCSGLSAGGVTPSIHDFNELVRYRASNAQFSSTPIFVMIRPRGGDFVYSDEEFKQMKSSLAAFRDLNADGFVFGILKAKGVVDEQRNRELVALEQGKPCTFHRAFDAVSDIGSALEVVIQCGFKYLLTSGGRQDVIAGKQVLTSLVNAANGRLAIMPCGGLRSTNLPTLISDIDAQWWHSSAIVEGEEADYHEITNIKSLLNKMS